MATFYSNLNTKAATGAETGSTASPYPEPTWRTRMENGGDVAGTIWRQYGFHTNAAAVDVFLGNTGQILDGWGGPDAGGYDLWGVSSAFDYFGSADSVGSITTRRGAFGDVTLTMRSSAVSNTFTWDSCYFYDGTSITVQSSRDTTTFVFRGCTFNTPILSLAYAGTVNHVFVFEDCLFNEGVVDISTAAGIFGMTAISFTRCTVVGTSESAFRAAMDVSSSKLTMTNCSYVEALTRPLEADVTAISSENMRYSMFGLPEDLGSYSGYNHGFAEEGRQGPGAFYFGIQAASASVDSETGAGPRDCNFTGTEGGAVTAHFWDFGDGQSSDEQNPTHTYETPGEYEVTYTITDAFGYTSSTTLTVYVTNWDYGSGYVVSKTDFCARHAIPQQPAQGVGWSFYNGDSWPYPIGKVGTVEMESSLDENIPLVIDATTFKTHELGIDDLWRDGQDEYGGSEIEAEIIYPELYAKLGSDIYRHSETHINVKPWYKNQRSTLDFDADGYRPDFSMDAALRQDSLPTDFVVTREVPVEGQIVADRHFESKFIQLVTRLFVAPWRVVMVQMWAKLFSKGSAPPKKLMSEMSWALAWSTPLLWIGRDQLSPTMNRATGVAAGGSFTNTTIGPDGKSGSAVVMGAADSLTDTMTETGGGEFAIGVWLRSIGDQVVIFNDGTLTIRVRTDDEGYALRFEDDENDIRVYLNEAYADWAYLVVVRDGNSLIVYENGVLTNTANLRDANDSYGGAVTLLAQGCQFSDLRVVANAPDLESVLYMYRDMAEHNGDSTCPIW